MEGGFGAVSPHPSAMGLPGLPIITARAGGHARPVPERYRAHGALPN